MPRGPQHLTPRAERKADLLLASELLRGQVQRDVDDLGQRADGLANRALVVRDWLSDPVVLAAAASGAAFFTAAGPRRRSQFWRGLRWAWLVWRLLGKR